LSGFALLGRKEIEGVSSGLLTAAILQNVVFGFLISCSLVSIAAFRSYILSTSAGMKCVERNWLTFIDR
jgi:hypothetical protein